MVSSGLQEEREEVRRRRGEAWEGQQQVGPKSEAGGSSTDYIGNTQCTYRCGFSVQADAARCGPKAAEEARSPAMTQGNVTRVSTPRHTG